MREQGEIVAGLRERYERIVVDDKGDVFNNDLTQALELGFLLELARVHGRRADSPARRAAAPTRGRTTTRTETTRTTCGTRSSAGSPTPRCSTGSR